MVAAAVGVAAAAGLAGSAMSSSAAKDAAKTQANAANSANAVQLQEFNQQQANQAPWLQTGKAGLGQLSNLLGIAPSTQQQFDGAAYLAANPDVAKDPYYSQNPYQHYLDHGQSEGRAFTPTPQASTASNDASFGSLLKPFSYQQFTSDPGYQFQLQQGDLGLQTAMASRGQLTSSATAKGLAAYNQGLANTSYDDAFNRYQTQNTNTFNRLATISGVGQVAANQTNQAAGAYAGQVGSNLIGAGNAAAAGQVGSANAISGGLSNAGNSLSQYSVLSNLLGGNNGGVAGGATGSFNGLGGDTSYLNGNYGGGFGNSGSGGTFSLLANGG